MLADHLRGWLGFLARDLNKRFLRVVALYGGAFIGAVTGAILSEPLLRETGEV
jgi:hypothetical protein